jgi:hypothetical protein
MNQEAQIYETFRVMEALYDRYVSHPEPRPLWMARATGYAMMQCLAAVLEARPGEPVDHAGAALTLMICAQKYPALFAPFCEALTRNCLHEWRLFIEDRTLHDTRSALWWCLHRLPYKQYLETSHWRALRHERLKAANYRCQVCNAKGILNVHHRTYERRGAELPEDVIVLCRSCHSLFHGNGKLASSEDENCPP